jgi:lysophospholipase L1-like esterase
VTNLSKKKQEKANVVIVDDDENVSTHNRYEILSDRQEDNEFTSTSHDTNESAQTKSRKSQGGKDKSRNKKRNKASTSTVIIGDSMIKHLDSRRLQRSIKGEESKVFSETYCRGAKISAIKHHIKPCLDKKPTHVILHVGTNDLPEKHPSKIVDGIAEICDIIQTESPSTEIVISEVILRTDGAEYKQKIGETNTLLASFCESRNLYIIKYNNIGEPHINPYGVHFNRAGTSVLARNILDYLNMHGKSN